MSQKPDPYGPERKLAVLWFHPANRASSFSYLDTHLKHAIQQALKIRLRDHAQRATNVDGRIRIVARPEFRRTDPISVRMSPLVSSGQGSRTRRGGFARRSRGPDALGAHLPLLLRTADLLGRGDAAALQARRFGFSALRRSLSCSIIRSSAPPVAMLSVNTSGACITGGSFSLRIGTTGSMRSGAADPAFLPMGVGVHAPVLRPALPLPFPAARRLALSLVAGRRDSGKLRVGLGRAVALDPSGRSRGPGFPGTPLYGRLHTQRHPLPRRSEDAPCPLSPEGVRKRRAGLPGDGAVRLLPGLGTGILVRRRLRPWTDRSARDRAEMERPVQDGCVRLRISRRGGAAGPSSTASEGRREAASSSSGTLPG